MYFECIRQTDLSSCGPTCIQMICQYYGKKIPLDIINEHVGLTNIGASVRDLNDGMKSLRLQSVVVECPIDKLIQIPLPAILYWRNNHFVVLYKVSDRYFYVADPASGKVRFSKAEFLINWACGNNVGTVVLVAPTPEFEKEHYPDCISSWRDVLREVVMGTMESKTRMTAIICLILLSCVCSWYTPILYKDLIDNGVLEGNLITVVSLFSAWFAFFFAHQIYDVPLPIKCRKF